MAGNSFGNIFKITSFGESHGIGIGVIIDGCPAGLKLSPEDIQIELDRRKPGQSKITTQRKENDQVIIQSGVFEGKTLGTPISLYIGNQDQRSKDYSAIKDIYRPSHADFSYQEKYGIRDYRGGGRSSARETASRVAAGAIAKKILNLYQIQIHAFVSQVYDVCLDIPFEDLDLNQIESNIIRCPDAKIANKMIARIEQARKSGDSLGGQVSCYINNCPQGLGEPVFDKLEAQLAKAMLSINAVKGFEIGSGFSGTKMKGSEHNDVFHVKDNQIKTQTNFSGGIQGGISNGMPIYFNVAFKPTATILQKQYSVNENKEKVLMNIKGRHDPCVLPRAVPIVEAMSSLVLVDFLLLNKLVKLSSL